MRGSDSALVEFSFVSRLADGLPMAALLRLERQSVQFNHRNGLTGEMRVEGNVVHQVVEGCWSVVMPLVAHILTDRRHEAISIGTFEAIAARRFDGWTVTGIGAPCDGDGPDLAGVTNLRVLPLEVVEMVPERAAQIRLP